MYWLKKYLTKYFMFLLDSDFFINTRLGNWRHKKKSELYNQKSPNILWGRKIYLRYPDKLSVGSHSLINDNFTVYGDGGVIIGNYVYTAPDVKIITASHNPENMEETKDLVEIKNLCWIGAGVTILPGVSIGKGSIIGAGSVVTKTIPEYTLATGNPCRVNRKRNIKYPYRLPGGYFYLTSQHEVIIP